MRRRFVVDRLLYRHRLRRLAAIGTVGFHIGRIGRDVTVAVVAGDASIFGRMLAGRWPKLVPYWIAFSPALVTCRF